MASFDPDGGTGVLAPRRPHARVGRRHKPPQRTPPPPPPEDPGGGGGYGGGGDEGHFEGPQPDAPRPDVQRFALALAMAAVLLGLTLVLAAALTVVQQGGRT